MKCSHLVILSSPIKSGAEISFFEFITSIELSRVFVAIPSHSHFYHDYLPKNCKIIPLPLFRIRKSFNPIYYAFMLFNALYISVRLHLITKGERITTIYCNSLSSFLYIFLLSFFRTDIKYICHVRDVMPNKIFAKLILSRAHKVICISRFVYNQVPISDDNKVLVYNAIDTFKWQMVNSESHIRVDLGLNSNTLIVAQISQVTEWKNHVAFIHAASHVVKSYDDIHFLIVGSAYSKADMVYRKRLVRLITELKLNDRITFLSFREDIRDVFCQIDVLVHPAIDEPFGRVVIEAMALEKPVVAFRSGGVSEIIDHGKTGFLIEVNDSLSMATSISLLCKDPPMRLELGLNGRRRVEELFSFNGNYLRHLHQVLFDANF